MDVRQLHQTTLLDADGDLTLSVLVADAVAAGEAERPRDVLERLLGELGVEQAARVPPFFLPSVIGSLLLAAEATYPREHIAELWFAPAALVDPSIPERVRRFAGEATSIEIVSLGQSLTAAAAVASTADAALLAGFFAGNEQPLAALALPASIVVCVAGADGAGANATQAAERLEAWLRARAS